ncbi:putative GAL4-like Zn(II)2Cys6 (or C6 zinc) binuclear cluster DNA-binding domain [Lyophyllum shimeji]|uniref:GAL4-like Zn(II)2Cys6 (Or C6 zinc) binuclear cluster DNA-binding domain n=1 Tax=Lyophyllum shimeji TaxID=47721 RepID=A0A9P3UKU8_LYOSH|nr:putative GAL4-like Zn(II)2Cys6 (or C6 zinc) binuclear cluster DNA-binding domain [Lyophyllum shimeji]
MFLAPSRPRNDSYPAHHTHQPYSVPEYGTAPVLYSAGSQPYSVSLQGPHSFPHHQISAERHQPQSPASLLYPRPQSHEIFDAVGDTSYTKHEGPSTVPSHPPRRDSVALTIETYNPASEYQPLEQITGTRPRSQHSGDSSTASAPPPKRKPRREKPRIELAPDQPPTTQGKPRARVYVACIQCRARKIRCDGAKPACHNCSKRTTGDNDCDYDPTPKRRGPDKTPGARQRIARDSKDGANGGAVRRRRRTTTSTTTPEGQPAREVSRDSSKDSDSAALPLPIPLPSPVESDVLPSPVDFVPVPHVKGTPETCCAEVPHNPLHPSRDIPDTSFLDQDAFDLCTIVPLVRFPHSRDTTHAYITPLDDDGNEEEEPRPVSCEPSLNFTRKIWWDSLLSLYISPNSTRRQPLTLQERESAAQGITSDIRFLFNVSNYWFAFFHVPSFYANYFDPVKRDRMQPSLVLALLALSTFWQSSEVGLGHLGRERALRFRDEAQSALDASFNAGWIDETLAQAAWLLAMFEVCAHPLHSSERSNSSMVMLDSIIRSLSLTFVDADDPNTTTFPPGEVPAVLEPPSQDIWFPDSDLDSSLHQPCTNGKHLHSLNSPPEPPTEQGCSCRTMMLLTQWPEGSEHTPLWTSTPAWNKSWSEVEIRKESCRRLCWSSIVLAAGHASYTTAHRSEALNLFISDPSNYALLFSGESLAQSPALSSSHHSSKDTIWALYDRSFLLWHGCIRMRSETRATDDAKAHFAVKTWLEADALEAALNRHTCRIERQFIFQAREYIFNTRMCISHVFQRYVPLVTANVSGLFHRKKAEEWLTHQATVAERFMFGLHTITGNSSNLLARRPFFVFWFMSQISRALSLWERDNTLTIAIDVCKALLPALDYLTALWPCPEQRYRYDGIRERLANACYVAGVTPPPPSNLTLPPPQASI